MSTCLVNSMPRWFFTLTDSTPKIGSRNNHSHVIDSTDDHNNNNNNSDNNNNLSSDIMVASPENDFVHHQGSNDSSRYKEIGCAKEKAVTVIRTAGGYRYR
ncbi:hypothetical protein Trydic_g10534 [Trypoxylus dichotomus]